ncbi:linker histone h1 and h5 family domain-containing protein [Ditylenchus destructor]|nr:linker histone h1 and h5 family domain-containing protein [Ditylenchus destructor]
MSATENVSSAVASASKKTGKPKNSKSAGSKAENASVASHPTYVDMIKEAITELDDRTGSSKAAILKYVVQKFQVGSNMTMINSHLRLALKRGVATGVLKQTKGIGASGSFRIGGKVAAIPKEKKIMKSPKKVSAVSNKTKVKKSPKKAVSGTSKKANVAPKKAALQDAKAVPTKGTSTPARAQSTKKSAATKKATTPQKTAASKSGAAKKTVVPKKATASLKKSPNKAVTKKANSKKAAGDAAASKA